MSLMTARPSCESLSIQDPYFLDIERHSDWESIFRNKNSLKLEIGFGMGDFLIEMAIKEAHSNFIGIDFTEDGTLSLLTKIKTLQLSNIRVIYGDAKNKLSTLFKNAELEAIYINFPDPWPRKRHIKLRLINPSFANLIMQKISAKGRVHIATDSEPYAQEILDYFNAEPLCRNVNQNSGFLNSRTNLPKTKYEKSFIYSGERTHYLEYSRLVITEKHKKQKYKTPLKNKKVLSCIDNLKKPKSNDTLLTRKFQKAETEAQDACDLKIVADNIAEAGNKEWAKKVYKKVEADSRDSLDFNWLAYSVFEVFHDTNWARSIYKKSENTAVSSLDFNWLGYSISETIGDLDWAKRLYKSAENKPYNVRELCDLAESVSDTFGDLNWVKSIYLLAEVRSKEYSDCRELADAIYKNLGDKQKTLELYKRAESTAKETSDFCSLAEAVNQKFTDNEWAKNLYHNAVSKAKDSSDFCSLADSLCENLSDKEWAKKIYKTAENEAKYSYELRWLADGICKNLGQMEWGKKTYKKAEEKATFFYEFRWLAESLCKNLGDKEWDKIIYNKAENMTRYPSDVDCLVKSALKNLGEHK
jgi:tRNA (guanine-N7-)-methyltransferase